MLTIDEQERIAYITNDAPALLVFSQLMPVLDDVSQELQETLNMLDTDD